MMLGVTGCSSDDESVRKNGYDELPVWLVPQAEALAEEFKDEDIFYCLGSGPNFGLAYKLAMTMLMEGAIKHACPLYHSLSKVCYPI